MNPRTLTQAGIAAVFMLAALSAHAGQEGGGASGAGHGGTNLAHFEEALRQQIKSGELNRRVERYLVEEQYKKITNVQVSRFIGVLVQVGLITDVREGVKYEPENSCTAKAVGKNEYQVVGASTSNRRGDPICFNVPKIAREYFKSGLERAMTDLVALALHEHVHQYQQDRADLERRNEQRAREIGAWVLISLSSTGGNGPDNPDGGPDGSNLPLAATLKFIQELVTSYNYRDPSLPSFNRVTQYPTFAYSGCDIRLIRVKTSLLSNDYRPRRQDLYAESLKEIRTEEKQTVNFSLEQVAKVTVRTNTVEFPDLFEGVGALQIDFKPGYSLQVFNGPGFTHYINLLGQLMPGEGGDYAGSYKRELSAQIGFTTMESGNSLANAFRHAVKLCERKSPF